MDTQPPESIRVLLADEHTIIRRGIRAFFATCDDIQVVGEAEDGVRTLHLCEQLAPHVLLLDVVLPRLNGVEVAQAVRARHPHTQLVFFSSHTDAETVRSTLVVGAVSYLSKVATSEELIYAVRQAVVGKPTLSPDVAESLIQRHTVLAPLGNTLTARERDVLVLLVQGQDNEAIARQLIISRATVKAHLSRILTKLGARNRTEAVALAIQHRLIP